MAMADGLLGGVLGSEAQEKDDSTQAGPAAFAASVAARLSASHPGVAKGSSAFLKEQTKLLEAPSP